MHNCSQEKEICATTVFRRRELVLYYSQEKESGALLFSGEGNWCTTVLSGERNWCTIVTRRRELVHNCYQEKETGATTVFRRRKLVLTVLRRRGLVLYFSREKGDEHVLYSGERKCCCTKFTG